MNKFSFPLLALLSLSTFAAACSSAREVEIAGAVTSSQTLGGPITLEFFDVTGEGEETERESVKRIELAGPGEFAEKVEVEGSKVLVRALDDADKSGACTEGEAWAEIEATIADDGTVARVDLALAKSACPASPAAP